MKSRIWASSLVLLLLFTQSTHAGLKDVISSMLGWRSQPKEDSIFVSCTFFYRADPTLGGNPTEKREEIRLPLNCDGRCLSSGMHKRSIGEFDVSIYSNGSIGVSILDSTTHKTIADFSQELKSGFNPIAGGTGLHYVYHPTEKGEIQWSCGIVDENNEIVWYLSMSSTKYGGSLLN